MKRRHIFVTLILALLCTGWVSPSTAWADRSLIMRGSTLQNGVIDTTIVLPDGDILSAIDLKLASFGVYFAAGDIIVYNLTSSTFYTSDPTTVSNLLVGSVYLYDPLLNTFNQQGSLFAQSTSIDSVLAQDGVLLYVNSDMTTLPPPLLPPVDPPLPPPDRDRDGIADSQDNCPSVANASQLNSDGDSFGDACDSDDDNDGFTDVAETTAGSDPLDPASTPEMCDGVDNDLDGQIDEDFPALGSACSAGAGECSASGVYVCTPDGSGTVCNAQLGTPSVEICDDLDNNCDGQVDEGFDADGDGTADCFDGCPADPAKLEPGLCGCGIVDTDTDSDGQPNCIDSDDDNDGMADVWEGNNGFDPLVNDAAGDADGDGSTNVTEYRYGSDPRSALSVPQTEKIRLYRGFNLISIPADTGVLNLTAFALLNDIGGYPFVSTIMRFNPVIGVFETAAYDINGTVTGVDFPLNEDEGYILYMQQDLSGFMP